MNFNFDFSERLVAKLYPHITESMKARWVSIARESYMNGVQEGGNIMQHDFKKNGDIDKARESLRHHTYEVLGGDPPRPTIDPLLPMLIPILAPIFLIVAGGVAFRRLR